MGVEYELKFCATESAWEKIRKEIVAEEKNLTMESTYYDTCDGAFSRKHYTLRMRKENGLPVYTLKTPMPDFFRGEWETTASSLSEAVNILCEKGAPTEVKDMFAQGVIPICGAQFTRIAKTVTTRDCTVEIALDKGVLTGGGKSLDLLEVEVELKAGSQAGANAYAAALKKTYGLLPEKRSKFSRALALYRGE